jgi:hypothetical protein
LTGSSELKDPWHRIKVATVSKQGAKTVFVWVFFVHGEFLVHIIFTNFSF